jgi:hypothetical protein
MGVALRAYGGAPYFAGTFLNFLHFTNLTSGELPGCLTPKGPSQTLYHAKPVIIQGALLAARQTGNFSAFLPHADAMRALLHASKTPKGKDSKKKVSQSCCGVA